MGYCVQLVDADYCIPVDKVAEAFERLKALNHKPGVEKRGGSWSNGAPSEEWFSWMDAAYDQKVQSLDEIFEQLGFSTCRDEEGNLHLTSYDSKTGQEELFLDEVADLCRPGSSLDWLGEDGERWQQSYGEKPVEPEPPALEPLGNRSRPSGLSTTSWPLSLSASAKGLEIEA